MDRDWLLLWVAAVLAGTSVVLGIAGAVTGTWFVLLAALPFALPAVFMYQQATGRLQERMRERARRRPREERGGFGAGARRTGGRSSRARRAAREARRRRATAGQRRSTGGRRDAEGRRRPPNAGDAISREEAYRRLDVEPGADEAAVRDAYREKVKEVHPDAEGGDEERFKRVTEAYERLTDD